MKNGTFGRMMRFGVPTIANAISVLLLQVLALVSLAPVDFGRFSAIYLLYGLANSILLSTISEAWQRHKPRAGWGDYGSVLAMLSVAAGLATLAICLASPGLRHLAPPATIAMLFAVYRTGARYYSLQQEEARYILPGDASSLLVLAVAWPLLQLNATTITPLESITWAWALSAMVSVLLSRRPPRPQQGAVKNWRRRHGSDIRTLLTDSMILDASAIGVPYAIIPLLSLSGFGTYRALSNISGPVKLILFPARPLFSKRETRWFAQRRVALSMLGVAAVLGACSGLALWLLVESSVSLGTLNSLAQYWPLATVFVAATFLNGVYYLIGRTHFPRGALLAGRTVATSLGIILPLSGALAGGVDGAILGTTLSTTLVAGLWMLLTSRVAGYPTP